jgi:hypothetical protein
MHHPHIPASLLALAALSLLAAGCGSGSSPSSVASIKSDAGGASSTSSTPSVPTAQSRTQMEQAAVAFAGCMRSHGVPGFPDPTTSPHGFKESLNPSKVHAAAFGPAEAACRHLLPAGGPSGGSPARSQAQIAEILAFARCIRSHGVPSFPDPTGSGELSHEMLARAGVDVHQPAVVHAADACASITHGLITKAVIARFVAGH